MHPPFASAGHNGRPCERRHVVARNTLRAAFASAGNSTMATRTLLAIVVAILAPIGGLASKPSPSPTPPPPPAGPPTWPQRFHMVLFQVGWLYPAPGPLQPGSRPLQPGSRPLQPGSRRRAPQQASRAAGASPAAEHEQHPGLGRLLVRLPQGTLPAGCLLAAWRARRGVGPALAQQVSRPRAPTRPAARAALDSADAPRLPSPAAAAARPGCRGAGSARR